MKLFVVRPKVVAELRYAVSFINHKSYWGSVLEAAQWWASLAPTETTGLHEFSKR